MKRPHPKNTKDQNYLDILSFKSVIKKKKVLFDTGLEML